MIEQKPYSATIKPGETVVIGRLAECDIVIPLPQVSRRHAQIVSREDGKTVSFELKNLSQSINIFFATPSSIPPLSYEQTISLTNDCRFILGNVVLHAKLKQIQIAQLSDLPDSLSQVRCSNCHKVVNARLKDCPWCGTTLAFGGTLI